MGNPATTITTDPDPTAMGDLEGIGCETAKLDVTEPDDPDRRYVVGPWKHPLLAGSVVPDAVRDRLFDLLKRLP